MRIKVLIFLIIASLQGLCFANKVPRQKIYIKGEVKSEKVYKVNDLEKLPTIKQKIIDPYSKNATIIFTGILLSELFKIHANTTAKKMQIIAVNDYKVTIPIELAKKEKLLLAFKGDNKYLTVSNRGPARIVVPNKGKLTSGALAKEGVNWVWFVKTINFIK
jgi:hypothetical protein